MSNQSGATPPYWPDPEPVGSSFHSEELRRAEEVLDASAEPHAKISSAHPPSGNLCAHPSAVAEPHGAAELGFSEGEALTAVERWQVAGFSDEQCRTYLGLAFDLARFAGIPLPQAADAILFAALGDSRPLRRLGVRVLPEHWLRGLRVAVQGQALAYAATFSGQLDVAHATGRITTRFYEGMKSAVRRVFGGA